MDTSIVLSVCFFGISVALAYFLFKARASQARFSEIRDIEEHLAKCNQELEALKDEKHATQCKIEPLTSKLAEMEQKESELKARLGELKVADDIVATIEHLKKEKDQVEETLEMQSFGFYHFKFDLDSPSDYVEKIKDVRDKQKWMIKDKQAAICETEWTVEGSKVKGRQMTNKQIKLMLRAFNGECDAAMTRVKYNNIETLKTRMQKSYEAINKLGESNRIHIQQAYLKLKLDEICLVHEHKVKIQEEKEEQRRIREEMREEQKALKEIEREKLSAEKDHEKYVSALENAKLELEAATGKQVDRLTQLIEKMELQLKDAIERKARAVARAQLTRSGHVYIISNIGSFGETIYKIGMTRRLEPLERVKELGDASVPFKFDVHAIIYSEDAPTLEKALHKQFEGRRVNKINMRREYFRVTLEEIKRAVAKHHAIVTFVEVPEAEEYRQTLAIERENQASEQVAS